MEILKLTKPIQRNAKESVDDDTISVTSESSDIYLEEIDNDVVEEVDKYADMTFQEKLEYNKNFNYYNLAKQTYKDIYNMTNARGATKLKPASMMGKPIQLEIN